MFLQSYGLLSCCGLKHSSQNMKLREHPKTALLPGPQQYVNKQTKTTNNSLKGHYSTYFWGSYTILILYYTITKAIILHTLGGPGGHHEDTSSGPGHFQWATEGVAAVLGLHLSREVCEDPTSRIPEFWTSIVWYSIV